MVVGVGMVMWIHVNIHVWGSHMRDAKNSPTLVHAILHIFTIIIKKHDDMECKRGLMYFHPLKFHMENFSTMSWRNICILQYICTVYLFILRFIQYKWTSSMFELCTQYSISDFWHQWCPFNRYWGAANITAMKRSHWYPVLNILLSDYSVFVTYITQERHGVECVRRTGWRTSVSSLRCFSDDNHTFI